MSWKDVFTNFESNVDELTFVTKLSTFRQKNVGMGNHFAEGNDLTVLQYQQQIRQCLKAIRCLGDRVTATRQRHLVTLVTTSSFQSNGRERSIHACNTKSFSNAYYKVL